MRYLRARFAVSSPGGRRSNVRGKAPLVRPPITRMRTDTAWRAGSRGHPRAGRAQGPALSGLPVDTGRPVKSGQRALRRAIPLGWGTEGESKDGRLPTPKQTTGA